MAQRLQSSYTVARATATGPGTVSSSDIDTLGSCIQRMQRLREELGIALAECLLLSAGVVVEGKVDVQAA